MPYKRFSTEHLTLRDVLAIDRTIAANERTMLGYVRTSLALLAAGGSMVHFFDSPWARGVGLWLLGVSGPVLFVGTRHFLTRRRRLVSLMGSHVLKQ